MLYQRLVLTLWLAIICCVGGWQDLGSVSRIQPYGRPFKLNSLRDSLPNTRPRARRESSRRRPRGKYEYNLKRTAIRDAKNRNALCLGKIDNLTNELCYCGGFRLVIFELRTWFSTCALADLSPGGRISTFGSVDCAFNPMVLIAFSLALLQGSLLLDSVKSVCNWECPGGTLCVFCGGAITEYIEWKK